MMRSLPKTTALLARAACLALLAGCLLPLANVQAQVAVTSIGDVSPIDSPFIAGDQGIPTTGNTVITTGVNADGQPVDEFGFPEIDENGNPVGQFNYERNINIQVGRLSSGQLFVTGGAALRYGDLIIGGIAPENITANNLDIETDFGEERFNGVGLVEISGAGSVYNNHPLIIPTPFQVPASIDGGGNLTAGDPESTTFTVPDVYNPSVDNGGIAGPGDQISNIRRGADEAFDLYVGLRGTGVLNILAGGRGEIRDGAFIGIGPTAVGTVNVDGLGSYLGVYGMKNPVSDSTPGEETIIGLYGEGTLSITNGGRVDSFNRAALGASDGEGREGSDNIGGGRGNVLVEGAGSTWRVFGPAATTGNNDGTLAIGEYFEETQDLTIRIDTLFTNVAAYEGEDGRGRLTIRDGGLVSVHEDELTDNNDDGSVRIGFYGELQLTGGRIDIGNRLDNDGMIRTGDNVGGADRYGDGEIDTGTFLNSPLGIVQVRASERLTIRSVADDPDFETVTGGTTTANYFYANLGTINVLGDTAIGKAEIEFVRDRDPSQNGTPTDSRFKNLRLAAVPNAGAGGAGAADVRGQIAAQDAVLYFRSDLLNEGDLIFNGGSNSVVGDVENAATGVVSITNESHVTFQGNVQNDGFIVLNDESDVTFAGNFSGGGALIDLNPAAITVLGDYQTDGLLEFVLGGGNDGLDFTRLGVLGDADFGANATLAIDALSLTGVVAGASFKLIDINGTVTNAGDARLLTTELPDLPASSDLFLIPDVDITDGEYILGIGSFSDFMVMPMGGDVNGDGVVNFDDVLVWQMFNGLESGGTIALGDADGDGDVDAADLAIINMQLGGPPSAAAAALTVPEPSSLLLLLAAGLVGRGRRRR